MSAADFNIKPLKWALILPKATLTKSMVGNVPAPNVNINKPPSMMVVAEVALIAMAKVSGHGIKPFNNPAIVAPSIGPLVLDSA